MSRMRLKQLAQDGATKGTVAVFNGTAWTILAAGTNGQVLSADSTTTTGLAWITLASPGSYTAAYTGSTR